MKDLEPRLDPEHLAVVKLPAGWQPPNLPEGTFAAVVSSDLEVTVVCPESMLEHDGWTGDAEQVDIGWRRVTFPGPLPWEQVGFLADVAGRLAGAQIPFTSIAGFTTDHVLVRAAQADLAVVVLSGEEPPPQRPGINP
ncbi:MAG: ACT domain-containing protein [Frankiaceae bacterium]|nr:ACT domain-containing protein [Frankiaceae bacterium]